MADPFSAGPYTLDFDALRSVEVHVEGEPGAECQIDEAQARFTDVFAALGKERPETAVGKIFVERPTCEVTTATCKHEISGDRRPIELLATLLSLESRGVHPFACTWFYYSHDICLQDPQESWSFFLVDRDGRIVAEDVPLFGHIRDDNATAAAFYLTEVQAPSSEDQLWTGERAKFDAAVRDAYAQFYETTRTGRMTVLRSDEPTLYHYSRPGEGPSDTDPAAPGVQPAKSTDPLEALISAVNQLRNVVWVLAVLVLILLVRSC